MRVARYTALCLLAGSVFAASTLAATLPADFSEVAITGTITNGTAIEFSPDGKLYVLEQAGTMEVYEGSGASAWTQVAPGGDFFTGNPLTVDSNTERGLLGIAFDPDFTNNRFLYIFYTATTPASHHRISRFTANAAGTQVEPGSEAILADLENLTGQVFHNGGALHFGPDGKLYVGHGDNVSGTNSQSIATRKGKILRLNPDPLNPIPSDNPTSIAGIAGTPTGNNRMIWAAGVRNPFTFAFHPTTGRLHIMDVGQNMYQEINLGAAGANYGYPATEGPFEQATFPNFTHPIVAYPQTGTAGTNHPAGLSFTGRAITGGAFYAPATNTFPAEYTDDYFFSDYVGDYIKRYDFTLNQVFDFATNVPSPTDMRVGGGDGALYYLTRESVGAGQGRVFRVQYTPGGACCVGIKCQIRSEEACAMLKGAWIGAGTTCAACDAPPPCPEDIIPPGGDGQVTIADINAVLSAYGLPCDNCPQDIMPQPDGDNQVTIADINAVLAAYGPCSP